MRKTFLLSSEAAFYLRASMTWSRKLLHIPLFTFKLLWPGPGMSNVCVSPPARILLSFKALRLKGEKEFIERQNKRKGGGWGRVTSGPWKPGFSHQATNRSSFKAWQGAVRSTEREGMGVCDREMCVCVCVDPSVSLRMFTHKLRAYICCAPHCLSLPSVDKQEQVTRFMTHLL